MKTSNTHVRAADECITFDQYDCVLYVIDLSRNFKEDLEIIANALMSHQTLAIAVVNDGVANGINNMTCMIIVLERLGLLEGSALASTRGHWRLWCSH